MLEHLNGAPREQEALEAIVGQSFSQFVTPVYIVAVSGPCHHTYIYDVLGVTFEGVLVHTRVCLECGVSEGLPQVTEKELNERYPEYALALKVAGFVQEEGGPEDYDH